MKILSLTLDELIHQLNTGYGKGRYHAEVLLREVHKNGNPSPLTAPEFIKSPKLQAALEGQIQLDPGQVDDVFDEGELTKFITRLSDGQRIESVIIPMTRYNTLCVSSQVGCRMGCKFCQTGQMGLIRNLTVEEIVGQLFNARQHLKKEIKNIVFMGMGEPFDNFDTVMQAVAVMTQQKGFDIAPRHITLSTSGLIPGIEKLATLDLPGIRLAVSINAPDNAIRSQIMPVNQPYPLEKLKQALLNFPLGPRGTFMFEYILIKDLNDSEAHAQALADFIHPLPVRLNLIPFNPVPGFDHASPNDESLNRFAQILTDQGVFVIKRWSKGRSVSAGCGQLGRSDANECSP